HILRKTYGYNKKEDEISLSQFQKVIPVSKPSICKALNNLQLVNIIKLVKKGKSKNSSNLYCFNKNYDEWQLVKKSKLVKNRKLT
ncbi:replication protein, partial [Klebsiella pneumoniae]|uniref:replication protein n=1 Tax=Klebsiella pneumoniae TaxID=573 RepID=UPI0025A0FA67